MPINSEEESEAKSYTDIQSYYVVNIIKMKLLEARVLAYDTMTYFIIPEFLGDYALDVEEGDRAATGMYIFKKWSKICLQHKILFQRDSYYH